MSRTPFLSVENINVVYRSFDATVSAVKDVSITVGVGEAVGIVGESGSGKSTLARAMLGLIPPQVGGVDSGHIRIRGNKVHVRDYPKLRGKTIAMVFQDPLSFLNPIMTIGKQIGESVSLHDPGADRRSRVEELLRLVHLPVSCMQSYPHELSGGMRQRVLLAIALGCRAEMLIGDEPTTALDVTIQNEVLALIRDVKAKLNISLILISHDLAVVSSVCDRIYVMYHGRIVESGDVRAVIAAPLHPYTRGLFDAARARKDESGRFIAMRDDTSGLGGETAGCPFVNRCDYAMGVCANAMPPVYESAGEIGHSARCWLLESKAAHAD